MEKNPAPGHSGLSGPVPLPAVLTAAETKQVAGGDAGPAPYNKNGGGSNGPIPITGGDCPRGDFAE
jgi:hypothetical protein